MTLCCNEKCELSKLNCLVCLMQTHKKCNKYMIRLEDIMSNSISDFHNWYDDAMVSEIASLT